MRPPARQGGQDPLGQHLRRRRGCTGRATRQNDQAWWCAVCRNPRAATFSRGGTAVRSPACQRARPRFHRPTIPGERQECPLPPT